MPNLFLQRDTRIIFHCPGCDEPHILTVVQTSPHDRPCWNYNNNPEKPTVTPSVLIRSGHFIPGQPNNPCPHCDGDKEDNIDENDTHYRSCRQCHSFITDGKIQFLDDCTHALKGQTVDLPPLEDGYYGF